VYDGGPDVRRRLELGEFGTSLGKEYGVSSGLIYHIKKGRIWKHLFPANDSLDEIL
jgi:hypothetical protein